MTDFFDGYGQALHRAARRRARRGRAVRAAGALAAAAFVVAFAVPAVVRDDPEREVAAPAATATAEGGWTEYAPLNGCGRAEPYVSDAGAPPELLRRYRILRDGTAAGAAALDIELPEVARVFPRAGRMMRVDGTPVFVTPVLLWSSADCDRADARPGLCVQPAGGAPNCAHRKPVFRIGEELVQLVPDDESPTNITRDLRP